MSGHSKWANIKNRKAAQDKKRSNIFTKLAKEITVASRLGGGDPSMNFRLRVAVDKAKQMNMPKDNIDRAIKKGTGELDGGIIEELIYEGFGPGGVAVIVESTTDNKNRTAASVRTIFNKMGGTLGSANSVMWMFDHVGFIQISSQKIKDTDDFMLKVIDQGAKDVKKEDNDIVVMTDFTDFQKILEYIESLGIQPEDSEITYVANDEIELGEEAENKINEFVDRLMDDDDVNNVYTNIK